jgi:Protein of unknown function (DUF2577).
LGVILISQQLADALRKLQKQLIDNTKFSDVIVGQVVSVAPLQIKIEQQGILPGEFFRLTRNVVDHYVDIEVNHVTENRQGGSGDPAFASHNHDYKGRKKIRIYNGLQKGESVFLLRCHGGQEFIIIDRVHDHIVSGEWL